MSGYQNAAGEYEFYGAAFGSVADMQTANIGFLDNNGVTTNFIKSGDGNFQIRNSKSSAAGQTEYSGRTVVLEGKLYVLGSDTVSRTSGFDVKSGAGLFIGTNRADNKSYYGAVTLSTGGICGEGSVTLGYNNADGNFTLTGDKGNFVHDGTTLSSFNFAGNSLDISGTAVLNAKSVVSTGKNVTLRDNAQLNVTSLETKWGTTLTVQDNAQVKVAGFMRLGNDKGTSGSEYTTKLVQTGGSVDVAGDLAIGHYRYLNAFYEISGGTLNVLNYNSAAMSGLWMAVDGNGTLAISGGEVNAGRINLNARDDELKGTLTMTGGVLNVGSGGIMATIVGDERYDINLEGGTITSGKVIAGAVNFAENGSWSSDLDINLTSAANPVVFETLGTSQIALNGAISGVGGLEKTGTGTLIMSGQNTYAGTTTVTEGKVQLSGGTLAGEIVVAEGATLAAAGAVGLKDLDVTGEFEVTPGLTKYSLTEGAVFHDGSLLTIADGHAQDWGTYDIVLAGEGFEVVHDTAWETLDWEALLSPELQHDWNLTLNAERSILTLGTDFNAIPEPATWVLLLLCAVGLPTVMRRAHLGQA